MKKLARFTFCVEDVVLARRFTPEVVSYGGRGRITLSSIQENQTVRDDGVDTTLGFSTAVSRNSDKSLQEKDCCYFSHQDEKTPTRDHDHVSEISSNPTALDDHGGDDEVVYNPMPLRWFRQDINGGVYSLVVDDDENEVDTTLRLRPPGTTNKKPRNSDKRGRDDDDDDEKKKKRRRRSRNNEEEQRPLVPINEIEGLLQRDVDDVDTTLRLGSTYYDSLKSDDIIPPPPAVALPPWWLHPDFNSPADDDDQNQVDTTLRLGLPGTSGGDEAKTSAAVTAANAGGDDQQSDDIRPPPSSVMNNPTPPRWLLPGFFDGVEDDEVDTTLSLRPPGSTNKESRNSDDVRPPPPPVINNPTPLRWFRPGFFDGVDDDEVDATLSLRPPGSLRTNKKKSTNSDKRVREGGGDDEQKKRRRRRRSRNDEEEQRPLVPIEEMEGLMQTVLLRGGSRPVFLYRKKLEDSDVKRDQNRLFVNKGERVMEFLREEEAAAVDGKGLTIVGVDGGGNAYEKLVIKKWASLNMTVINADWKKVVETNEAQKGDVMEIWGYRENNKSCLAFNFMRERDGEGGDNHNLNAASSSGGGGNGAILISKLTGTLAK